jgi:hypothetical protein
MKNPDPLSFALIILISVIQLTIKGFALWRASQGKQRNWFLVLFVLLPINEFGIVEILFLFKFAKKKLTLAEIQSWLKFGKN